MWEYFYGLVVKGEERGGDKGGAIYYWRMKMGEYYVVCEDDLGGRDLFPLGGLRWGNSTSHLAEDVGFVLGGDGGTVRRKQ